MCHAHHSNVSKDDARRDSRRSHEDCRRAVVAQQANYSHGAADCYNPTPNTIYHSLRNVLSAAVVAVVVFVAVAAGMPLRVAHKIADRHRRDRLCSAIV